MRRADPATATALLNLAEDAARRAGELLLDRFSRPASGVGSKTTPTDLVSDADRASERLLLEIVAEQRPGDGVLAEESGDAESSSGLRWVIDPLDGTVNFLFGIPIWSVSIAVEDSAGALVGVVHDPNRNETFTAERGSGARLNGAPIEVNHEAEAGTALVGTGFSYDPSARAAQAEVLRRVLPSVRDIRRPGSAAIDLAYVACGRLDGFFESVMEPYDRAAGALLIVEAGGVVSNLPSPLGGSSGVIAGAPQLHGQLERLVLSDGR
jgi:myo-inositol-1(or 4)-monophosphatase